MRILKLALVATSSPMLVMRPAAASIPTSFIDIHQVTSFTSTGAVKSGFLFRIEASESNFGGIPPKGPKWATYTALTSGAGSDPDDVRGKTTNKKSAHPSHRLMLPPDSDAYLCNEADGLSDYKNPAGNSAFDRFEGMETLLSGFEGGYMLIPRGRCTFEAKARSAQRLGAAGIIVRNTLDSRYGLVNEEATEASKGSDPDWQNTRWPVEMRDYECGRNAAADNFGWRAEIEAEKLSFDPAPYDGSRNDPILTGAGVDGNLCAIQPVTESFPKHCPSERCLLTGRNASKEGTLLEACCAWDSLIRMYTDGDNDGDSVPQEDEEDVTITALFVTMESGEELYDLAVAAEANSNNGETLQFLNVVAYARWYPSVHYSGALLWALALFALWVSAYESAKEYRASWKAISRAASDGVLVFQRRATNSNAGNSSGRERVETEDTVDEDDETVNFEWSRQSEMTSQDNLATAPASPVDTDFSISDDNEDDFVGNPAPSSVGNSIGNEGSSFAPEEEQQATLAHAKNSDMPSPRQEPQRVNLQSSPGVHAHQIREINSFHALIFVVTASAFLFVLFFFNLYKVVRVLYGLAGTVAMTQIILYPLYKNISSKHFKDIHSSACVFRGLQIKWIDIASYATGYSLGIAWIVVGLTKVKPMESVYYWFLQDVMGVCFCILILGLMHINNIMVASILLCIVFVYDAFYVLISPYFFGGASVMVEVANGGVSSIDSDYCEKYPFDNRQCRGRLAPLPMLLAIPWFNDFRGGFAMIGLGDVILPGLLISFAARFDAARQLVMNCSQVSTSQSGANIRPERAPSAEIKTRYRYHLGRLQSAILSGYFSPLIVAYAVGLAVAYAVVSATRRGQPALLYLVPSCLGTTFFLGWRRRELSELWSGPKALRKANRMVEVAGRIPVATAMVPGEQVHDPSLAETTTMV